MLSQPAFAKINIGLRILRKRSDGWHDIETVFHRIAAADLITVSPASKISFRAKGRGTAPVPPGIPTDGSNLCHRAAVALKTETGTNAGAEILLEKLIPAGAGLGGGSADAAITLLLLNELWGLGLPAGRLRSVAATLGADIPYFLGGGSASGTGRGDELRYFPLILPYSILTVFPGFGVPTADAYGGVSPGAAASDGPLDQILTKNLHDPERLSALVANDFESSVFASHPRLAGLKRQLREAGAVFASLSGSGSSVYGFFRSDELAAAASAGLGRDMTTFLTPAGFAPDFPPQQGKV